MRSRRVTTQKRPSCVNTKRARQAYCLRQARPVPSRRLGPAQAALFNTCTKWNAFSLIIEGPEEQPSRAAQLRDLWRLASLTLRFHSIDIWQQLFSEGAEVKEELNWCTGHFQTHVLSNTDAAVATWGHTSDLWSVSRVASINRKGIL